MWDQLWAYVVGYTARRSVRLGYAVSAVVLVGLTLLLVRRAAWPLGRRALAVAAALGLAIFPAMTLARRGIELRMPSCEWGWGITLITPEQLLNFVLLVPAGFFAGWALRRVWPVAVVALCLSAGVEGVQAVFGLGSCQTGDVVRNVAGAVLAAFEGTVVARLLLTRRTRRAERVGVVSPDGPVRRVGE